MRLRQENSMPADTILHNAKIATNSIPSFVDALAITDGKITATGNARDIFRLRGPATTLIDANRHTVIPGLNDSHMHPIRAGLSYNIGKAVISFSLVGEDFFPSAAYAKL